MDKQKRLAHTRRIGVAQANGSFYAPRFPVVNSTHLASYAAAAHILRVTYPAKRHVSKPARTNPAIRIAACQISS